MSVEEEITRAVRAAIRDSVFLTLLPGEDVFQLHARAAVEVLQPFIGELEQRRAEVAALDADNMQLAMRLGETAAEVEQLHAEAAGNGG